ncbi:MAG: DUF1153 domain-containing protein [Patescibacteria group bacterium]|nr:DUF1153 domain-containing protein [Patescibacteria group bacterium]
MTNLNYSRWTPKRKMAFVALLLGSDDTAFNSLMERFSVSPQEYACWHEAYLRNDPRALRVTKRAA